MTEMLIALGALFQEFEICRDSTTLEISKSQVGTVEKPLKPVYVTYKRRAVAED